MGAWAAALAAKWRLDCPRLEVDGMYQDDPEPCQVDVSWDSGRYFSSSPPFVAGHQTTVHLPFSGDPDLFQMRPSTFTLAGTPKAETHNDRLSMRVSYPDDRPLNIGAEARRWAEEIQKHLRWMEGDLDGFEGQLQERARTAIVAAKSQSSPIGSTLPRPACRRSRARRRQRPTLQRRSNDGLRRQPMRCPWRFRSRLSR